MELLEEFMFASPGQLSQLAYEASISDAPNASALAKLAAAAYATSQPSAGPKIIISAAELACPGRARSQLNYRGALNLDAHRG